jgi:peroxiredoxin
LDQSGAPVSLSNYCASVVYIAAGAMWCPGCQSEAEELEALYQAHKSQGFVTLTLMAETAQGKPPATADLQLWAANYQLTTPVLADPQWQVWNRYWPEGETPKSMLIGRGGIIRRLGWAGSNDIERELKR